MFFKTSPELVDDRTCGTVLPLTIYGFLVFYTKREYRERRERERERETMNFSRGQRTELLHF